MRGIVKFALRHTVRIAAIFTMLILLSVYGLFHVPVGLFPEVTYPEVQITYFYRAQNPEFIAQRFTPYIEGTIWSMEGVKSVESITTDKHLSIDVSLKYGEDVERFIIKVSDVLKDLKLPEYFTGPFVREAVKKTSDFEFYVKSLQSDTKDSILSLLRSLDGVKKIEVNGDGDTTINLVPRLFTLLDLDIARGELRKQISSYYMHHTFPLICGTLTELMVKPSECESLKLRNISFRNIFNIEREKRGGIFLCDGSPVILFRVYFKEKQNKLSLSKRVKRVLLDFQRMSGSEIVITYDIGEMIKKTYLKLLVSFSLGILALFLLLFLFERKTKDSIVAILTSILSAVVTLSTLFVLGLEVNMLTLSGLVFGLGLFVDSAIVFFEEFSHNLFKMNRIRALFLTASSIFSPLFSSTLTSLIVFVPFLYASTDIRIRYREFVIALSLALFASLLVIFLLLPPFLFSSKKHVRVKNAAESPLLFVYRRTIDYLTQKAGFVMVFYVLIVGTAPFVFKKLDKGHIFTLEKADINTITIAITPSYGSVKPEILEDKVVVPIITAINKFKKTLSQKYSIYTFSSITWSKATIEIKFNKMAKERGIVEKLRAYLETFLLNFGGVNIIMRGGAMEDFIVREGNMNPFMLTLSLYGYSYKRLLGLSEEVARRLKSRYFPYTVPNFYYVEGVPVYVLDLPLYYTKTYSRLKELSGKTWIEEDIILDEPTLEFYEAMSRFMGLERKEAERSIRRDNRYFKVLVGFAYRGPKDSLKSLINSFKKQNPLPFGFYYDLPQKTENAEHLRYFVPALFFSITLIVLLITAMFNGLKPTFLVLLTIPFTLSGIFLFFRVSHVVFNINAVLATLITLGIAVNDSIFLVKKALHTQEIHEAAVARARSIVYTSLTTIVTALPFLFLYPTTNMWHTFAYSIIGGITFSTFYALFILPGFIKLFSLKSYK